LNEATHANTAPHVATFDALFLELYPGIAATARRIVGDTGQAEEIASDAFYRLYKLDPRMRTISNPRSWLQRTALNLALDALRTNVRRSRREAAAALCGDPVTMTIDPLNELVAEQERQRVRNVLAALKPRFAKVLVLGSEGMSPAAIADALGMKPNSIYTIVGRARTEFLRIYTERYGASI
jgi:RNA polymerase sigma-70 factor (ECF subfamily)